MLPFWTIPFILCAVFLVGCLAAAYKQHQRRRIDGEERQRGTNVTDEEDDVEKQNKMESVKSRLVLKTWKDVRSEDDDEPSNNGPKSSRTRRFSLDVSFHSQAIELDTDATNTSPTEDTCGICLARFEPTDLVGSSTNSRCCHYFHKDCITEWLTKQEECPFCRETYLVDESSVEDSDNAIENGQRNATLNEDVSVEA
uniref:RING-type domain-containing protein n=1 Tax=Grammatophora oceanica TaxID=210454 RepID=A0A7S1Y2Z8_9STRA|mmetsp:Transcript_14495/g.21310  ORF Transcript_14495/g.21310 Transcript_14495/m.21310 type:complete len:198 (+) Transcript_14495:199-792(+)|eukprot:CAMPEP_0194034408 /NCGR_PEP_ID=MMETSP0009_2-20130614/6824_1 /TAXON_ID=210454 /ORGANISM="Grammatophora oceanica, Strain CCMP 410" /LENGTH=197 /DNA_ID=CAMNT_0038675321 /DNA_START=188 /DNA_END=781 /DNA_ORIENTATION=+